MQDLDGCGGGISLLHPHDPAVAQARGKQSHEQEREHGLVTVCARNHLLNITGDWWLVTLALEASTDDRGKRLDQFLRERLPQYSRSRLQDWIEQGRVLVNGAPKNAPTC